MNVNVHVHTKAGTNVRANEEKDEMTRHEVTTSKGLLYRSQSTAEWNTDAINDLQNDMEQQLRNLIAREMQRKNNIVNVKKIIVIITGGHERKEETQGV